MNDTQPVDVKTEWAKCQLSPLYAIHNYFSLFNATEKAWVPFYLWPEQVKLLREVELNRLLAVVKARQLGASWLIGAYVLYTALFRPIINAGMFSRTDADAQELLVRVKGMHGRLPPWMQAANIPRGNAHDLEFSNGSTIRARPYTQSEGATYALAFVDEADRFDNADELMVNLKPSIDMGGKLIVCSISSKDKPGSIFKNIFRGAISKENEWKPVFMNWRANPGRDDAWYEGVFRDAVVRHAGDEDAARDEMGQQYPSTWEEAFSPISRETRLPFRLLTRVFEELSPIQTEIDLQIPGLVVYREPQIGVEYLITCDTAEGLETSDLSISHVARKDTAEEVAILCGRYAPAIHAGLTHKLAVFYNGAGVMTERQNHGGTFILAFQNLLAENQVYDQLPNLRPTLLPGLDGRPGWSSTAAGKLMMYDDYHTLLRDSVQAETKLLHSRETLDQLAIIQRSTLKAPEGQHDDRAVAAALIARAQLANSKGFHAFRI